MTKPSVSLEQYTNNQITEEKNFSDNAEESLTPNHVLFWKKLNFFNLSRSFPQTQDVNWMHIGCSEDVLDVFYVSYICSIYVLFPGGYCYIICDLKNINNLHNHSMEIGVFSYTFLHKQLVCKQLTLRRIFRAESSSESNNLKF